MIGQNDCEICHANPATTIIRHPCAPNPMCQQCAWHWKPCEDCDISGDCQARKLVWKKWKERTDLLADIDTLLKRNHELRLRAEEAEHWLKINRKHWDDEKAERERLERVELELRERVAELHACLSEMQDELDHQTAERAYAEMADEDVDHG